MLKSGAYYADEMLEDAAEGAAALGAAGLGVHLLRKPLDRKNLFGRKKYYIFLKKDRADFVRNHGMLLEPSPGTSSGGRVKYIYDSLRGYPFAADRADKAMAYKKPSDQKELVEIEIPASKVKTVDNPVSRMTYKEYLDDLYKRHADAGIKTSRTGLDTGREEARYNRLKNTVFFAEDIPPEYIHGPKYKKPGLRDVLSNARHNPKVVLKTLAKPTAGLGLIGAATYGAYDTYKRVKERVNRG